MTIKQIGDVTNIDTMDELDRQKLNPRIKLELLCQRAKETFNRDPRSGGMVFVARPRIILQLLLDLREIKIMDEIRLHKAVVIGADGGDVVGFYQDIPLIVRSNTNDDRLHCMLSSQVPESKMIDRRRAAELRMHAHAGSLDKLREGDN